jgi:SAM-dependent methyltransferase
MGAVLDEVVGPDVVRPLRPEPDVGAVIEPETALLCLFLRDLPFRDDSIDTLTTISAFHFFRNPKDVLSEMRRVLRPGGRVVITDWCDDFFVCRICDWLLRRFNSAHFRVYGTADCRALLEGAGFENVRVERYKISWLWGLMTVIAYKPM